MEASYLRSNFMTDIKTDHPEHIPQVELVESGRKISFRRDWFGEIKIMRKVNDQDWTVLIEKARTPYIDEEEFPAGTELSYIIQLDENNERKQFQLDVHL